MSIVNDDKDGWTYYTSIKPFNLPSQQNLQNLYLENYNNAFNILIESLLIDKDVLSKHFNTINIKTNKLNEKYFIIINCDKNNNLIKLNNYSLEFEKSKFLNLKNKKIKQILIKHYKPLNLYVNGPSLLLDSNNKNYYVELCNYKKLN